MNGRSFPLQNLGGAASPAKSRFFGRGLGWRASLRNIEGLGGRRPQPNSHEKFEQKVIIQCTVFFLQELCQSHESWSSWILRILLSLWTLLCPCILGILFILWILWIVQYYDAHEDVKNLVLRSRNSLLSGFDTLQAEACASKNDSYDSFWVLNQSYVLSKIMIF